MVHHALVAILVAQLADGGAPAPDAGIISVEDVRAHFKTELYSLCTPQDRSPTSVVELPGRLLAPVELDGVVVGPTWELPDGGVWRVDWPPFVVHPDVDPTKNSALLSPEQSQRTACLMATCAARNVQLEDTGGNISYRTWFISMAVGLGLGILLGGALVGWLWGKFGK